MADEHDDQREQAEEIADPTGDRPEEEPDWIEEDEEESGQTDEGIRD